MNALCLTPIGTAGVAIGLAVLLVSSVPRAAGSQALAVKHPVMDYGINPDGAASYEAAVKQITAMTEEQMLSFVPDKPVTTYCECPNCYGGVEGNNIFEWSVGRPTELKCRFCGALYPNEKYPEDEVLEGQNSLGETIRFVYHQNHETGVPHFITGNLTKYRRDWLMRQCMALGKAYQATGKGEYARRVALVLDGIAQVYPHYPVVQDLPRRFRFRESQEPPWPWDSGRWGHFHNEIPKYAIWSYDMVCESEEFDRLSQERGYDVREKLEDEFFKVTFEAVAAIKHHVSNVVGYDVAGAAILGRVINEPRYVHWAFGWMKKNVDAGFFYDGMWHEAPSYHYMTIGGLGSAFSTVRGYSDPAGYVDQIDGTRFDDLDPENELPFYAKALHAPAVLDFPNGCSTTVHDTHPYERRSPARNRTVSTITPGYGHASLGRGTGAHQMQAQLHFSGRHGHAHLDNLNLTLWAKEREMLPDLGYTWTQMRYWCTCTVGHNTVVVDRVNQGGAPSDCDLIWFFPDAAGVSAAAADGQRGYANISGLNMYRRAIVMVPVSAADAYVLDLFHVRGGSIHDWALHGDADEDTTATCSLPLGDARKWLLGPDEEWVEPEIEGARFNPYGMLRDMRSAPADGGFRVSFRYDEGADRGIRIHMLPGGPAEVLIGHSPSVRRMGQGTRGDMRKAYDFWMPQLLVRRQGEAPLASVFAAIEEPFSGDPFISNVEPLALTPPDPNAVALQITHGDAVDTIISTLDEPPYPERVAANGVRLRGKLGLVREVAGTGIAAWLFEGLEISAGRLSITTDAGHYDGEISAAMRKTDGAEIDAFITSADVPLGEYLHGVWMIVTHGNGFTHGYQIDRIEEREGSRVIVLADDHGLRIQGDTTREVYYPQREIKGINSFHIPLSATVSRRGAMGG